MIYKYSESQVIFKEETAMGQVLANTPFNELVLLQIKEGGEVASHSLNVPVTFFVVEGDGVIKINDNSFSLSTNDVILVEAGCERAWINSSLETLKILAIKKIV